jgi:sirohydrochlorin cobaltochelatase
MAPAGKLHTLNQRFRMTGTTDNPPSNHAAFPREVGLLLVGHGSREAIGIEEFLATASLVADRAGEAAVEPCFLEFAEPTIEQGFRRLAERGVTRIVVVPVLLFAAGHAKRDIPQTVEHVAREWPEIEVRQAAHLGCHDELLQLSERRFAEAVGNEEPAGSTLLVLVGRGSNDAEATAEMHAFAGARAQRPRAATVRIEVGFIAMAAPKFSDVLDAAAATDAARVVIQPHLLFGGVLLDRLTQTAADYAVRYPEKQWLASSHLGLAPCVASAILARAAETLSAR